MNFDEHWATEVFNEELQKMRDSASVTDDKQTLRTIKALQHLAYVVEELCDE